MPYYWTFPDCGTHLAPGERCDCKDDTRKDCPNVKNENVRLQGCQTAPPFHPWCRCCTAPYYADMDGLGYREAYDAVTGERYKGPGSVTYEQWNAKQDELHGAGTVDYQRTISYNEIADKAQFERFKAIRGAGYPKTLMLSSR